MEQEKSYDDIIDLPHHVSPSRKRMSVEDRAAQFAPFAALTGYEAAVRETARLTEEKTELTEDEKAHINEKLRMLAAHEGEAPTVSVTYFEEDEKKEGGSYVCVTRQASRIDLNEKVIYFTDGTFVAIGQVRTIDGALFDLWEQDG